MQFLELVIDDLGKAVFRAPGEVENRGLLKVAGGGALISGELHSSGRGWPNFGSVANRVEPVD